MFACEFNHRMKPIDYTEKLSGETLKELRAAYDALHERAYKFVLLVAGSAGALSTYAIGRIGSAHWSWQSLPLGCLALWLFGVSGYLLLCGASTKGMLAGPTAKHVRDRLIAKMPQPAEDERDDAASLAERDAQSVEATRWDFTASLDDQISRYRDGVQARGRALDVAYLLAVIGSPLAIGIGLTIAWKHAPPWC